MYTVQHNKEQAYNSGSFTRTLTSGFVNEWPGNSHTGNSTRRDSPPNHVQAHKRMSLCKVSDIMIRFRPKSECFNKF